MKRLLKIFFVALPLFAIPPDPFGVNDNRLEELLRTLDIDTDPCEYTYTEDTTYISGGTLYDYHRWTKERSPYVIEGDLVVDTFAVLEVDAGVKILYEYGTPYSYNTNIYGSILMNGEVDDSIFVGSVIEDLRGAGGYGAFSCRESAQECVFRYIFFKQAGLGIAALAPKVYVVDPEKLL